MAVDAGERSRASGRHDTRIDGRLKVPVAIARVRTLVIDVRKTILEEDGGGMLPIVVFRGSHHLGKGIDTLFLRDKLGGT